MSNFFVALHLVANKYMIDNGVGLINIPLYCWDEWNKLISDYYYDNDMSKIKEWTYKVGIQGIDIFKTSMKDKYLHCVNVLPDYI